MSGKRRRRWANIETVLGKWHMFAWVAAAKYTADPNLAYIVSIVESRAAQLTITVSLVLFLIISRTFRILAYEEDQYRFVYKI